MFSHRVQLEFGNLEFHYQRRKTTKVLIKLHMPRLIRSDFCESLNVLIQTECLYQNLMQKLHNYIIFTKYITSVITSFQIML